MEVGIPGRWGTSASRGQRNLAFTCSIFDPLGAGVGFVTALAARVCQHKISSHSACGYSKGWFGIDYEIYILKQFKMFISGRGIRVSFSFL